MASTSVSRVVPASPERAWSPIGGFHALPDWLPYIPESTALEGGRVRRLRNPEGDVVVERLVNANEQERQCSYAIPEAPFPVTGYLSTLRVAPRGHTVAAPDEDDDQRRDGTQPGRQRLPRRASRPRTYCSVIKSGHGIVLDR
jgi:hypothetical protein